jgi:hypothetical protein
MMCAWEKGNNFVEAEFVGKMKHSKKKNILDVPFFHHKSKTRDAGDERPVTNRLNVHISYRVT